MHISIHAPLQYPVSLGNVPIVWRSFMQSRPEINESKVEWVMGNGEDSETVSQTARQ